MRFEYDDRVTYFSNPGRVQDSTSDETLVQFDDGCWQWILTNKLELE